MSTNEEIRRQIELLSGAIKLHKHHPGQSYPQPHAATSARPAYSYKPPLKLGQTNRAWRRNPHPSHSPVQPSLPAQQLHQSQHLRSTVSGSEPSASSVSPQAPNAPLSHPAQPIATSYIRQHNSLVRLGHQQTRPHWNGITNVTESNAPFKRIHTEPVTQARKTIKVSRNKRLVVKNGILHHSNGRTLVSTALVANNSTNRDKEQPASLGSLYSRPFHTKNGSGSTQSLLSHHLKYRRSKTSRRVLVDGTEFRLDHSGHRLVRVAAHSNNASSKVTPKRVIMNGVKSGQQSWRHKAWRPQKKRKYCQFYRYGRCDKGEKCRFIHDPLRITLCFSFLKSGVCSDPSGCKLSHKPSDANTPFCVHFEHGRCVNESCPYLHVKLSPNAFVCTDFSMEGYCEKGTLCTLRHVFLCPDFEKDGKCARGDKCCLPHRPKNSGDHRYSSRGASFESSGGAFHSNVYTDADEEFLLPPRPDFSQLELELQDTAQSTEEDDDPNCRDDTSDDLDDEEEEEEEEERGEAFSDDENSYEEDGGSVDDSSDRPDIITIDISSDEEANLDEHTSYDRDSDSDYLPVSPSGCHSAQNEPYVVLGRDKDHPISLEDDQDYIL
ncbi:hypothetical protein BASA50_010947 [Batrachochytrium salamandrivorans]|uniref:C3H1-type domain-containing protein n=1 Tax=Batrachochytrium salamandrivorans TaxID=1357716 RepID=A0ABQ8EXA6_9FUNG|nr:hypothetical protein BASA62_004873 [Batrachochytrium salamandrivorans]KAH6588085.1 hypothetical protein BASA50_010947 [Batrachochytrium salamandrivorans]KAH9267497.1 hypothetical protein BASA83_009885 [Batrachochytrium salamandrivorans]